MDKDQKLMLYNFIIDCETHRLTFEESREYVKLRSKGAIALSQTTWKRYKLHIHSDHELNRYFSWAARVGFVIEHRTRMQEMEICQRLLMNELMIEDLKEPGNREVKKMCALVARIESCGRFMAQLSMDTTIIAKIHQELQDAENQVRQATRQLVDLDPALSQRKF